MAAKNPLDPFLKAASDVARNLLQPPSTRDVTSFPGNTTNQSIRGMIEETKVGQFKHMPMTWRTPAYGFIQMYLNPQEVRIQDKKIYTSSRTKAGFVYQYAGEDLTNVSLSGTTGASGIEGINILENIYRSEHNAFNGVAAALDRRVSTAQLQSFFSPIAGALGQANLGGDSQTNIFDSPADLVADGDLGTLLTSITEEFTANMFDQPFPTLASLAANVEMYWQGQTFRGFFDSFSVTESAQSPGLFEYQMVFIAYARSGIRRNFMPWHRQPLVPSDSNANPLSFSDVTDIVRNPQLSGPTNNLSRIGVTQQQSRSDLLSELQVGLAGSVDLNLLSPATRQQILANDSSPATNRLQRVRTFGAGQNGKGLQADLDLNDLLEG